MPLGRVTVSPGDELTARQGRETLGFGVVEP